MLQFGSDDLDFLELSQMAYVGIGVVIAIFGKVNGCLFSDTDNPLEYSPQFTVVLEKTLESPSDCKEIQPVHSKGDQPWVFFGRNDAKAETPVLWPPDVKS